MKPPRDAALAPATDAQAAARPSKSQVKRDMHALLDLGKELVALPEHKLKRLPLSETLLEAILLAQRITSREGRRRQVHYVGKLMRQAPAVDIQAQLHAWKHGARAAPATPSTPSPQTPS